MGYMDEYKFWLEDSYFDADTKAELKAIADDEAQIEDRFYKDLEFGTGGLRGVIGAGTNRMNIYTVRKATQGLANYIIKNGTQDKGVTIAVSDSHTARVEILQAQPGEDAKKLMANAVVRICEMTREAAEDGINMPKTSISAMSKTGFWAIAGGLILGILLCIVICVMLFTKSDNGAAAANEATNANEMTSAGMEEGVTSDVPVSSTVPLPSTTILSESTALESLCEM